MYRYEVQNYNLDFHLKKLSVPSYWIDSNNHIKIT